MIQWEQESKALLRAELARADINYKVLSRKLEEIGVIDSPSALSSKISRGKFTFAFFLQCMTALGRVHVVLPLPHTSTPPHSVGDT
jgi:hypothetical protein